MISTEVKFTLEDLTPKCGVAEFAMFTLETDRVGTPLWEVYASRKGERRLAGGADRACLDREEKRQRRAEITALQRWYDMGDYSLPY